MRDTSRLKISKRDDFGMTDADRFRENRKTADGSGNVGVQYFDCGCIDSAAHGNRIRCCYEHRIMRSLSGKPVTLAT